VDRDRALGQSVVVLGELDEELSQRSPRGATDEIDRNAFVAARRGCPAPIRYRDEPTVARRSTAASGGPGGGGLGGDLDQITGSHLPTRGGR